MHGLCPSVNGSWSLDRFSQEVVSMHILVAVRSLDDGFRMMGYWPRM
jgi:hypothetical protein